MKIGLIDVDSKIPNIALMKLSTFHKGIGDTVEFWKGTFFNDIYDKIYASKVFDFSSLPNGLDKKTIIGGTGYDLTIKLPDDVEYLCPDYSLYPNCDYSIGFITRGCNRNCSFCKVPKKEGKIRFNQSWENFKNSNGKYWVFLDNNILAYENHLDILKEINERKMVIDFNQATDIRLVTEENAKILATIKWHSFYRFSFDWVFLDKQIIEKVKLLNNFGLSSYKMFCFILIGYNTTVEEDLYRVELCRELKVNPFVMPYNKFDKYQKDFSRWVNHKAIFKSVAWEDYKKKNWKMPTVNDQQKLI